MRIQHNIAALNSYRNLTNNNSAVSKNLEKLSSGYRINRAGDDAAGLAISEKMRAQITGLKTAQKNANDGISLVQTAEGALTEVHSMLNRMVELATQSANGTYDNAVDRANLQKEVDSLMDEINRISEGTNFNGINLLDGTYGSAKPEMSDPIGIQLENRTQLGTASVNGDIGTKVIPHKDGLAAQKPEFTIDVSTLNASGTAAGDKVTFTITGGTSGTNTLQVTVGAGAATGRQMAENLAAAVNDNASGVADIAKGIEIDGLVYVAEAKGDQVVFTLAKKDDGTEQDLTTPTDLKQDMTIAVADNGNGKVNGSISTGALNVKEGIPKNSTQLANAEFILTTNMVKDGAQLTIGNETYTFRVGKNSFIDKSAQNVIDLSDFEVGDSGLLEAAGVRLSEAAANNDMFFVGTNKDAPGQIGLQERSTYKGKADLTTVEGIEAQLSYKTATPPTGEAKSLTLQIGDTSDDYNKLKLHIDATDAATLGIADINIGTQEGAAAAVDKIKAAINAVSSVRGDLGAIQNRLEHTINNLSVQTENITAAESRIRDVDMAEEMMAYTKNNILVQASQAMLAQANQVPQGVLQLLQ